MQALSLYLPAGRQAIPQYSVLYRSVIYSSYMKLVDLTHAFTDNMPVYPGDPASTLVQTASIEKDTYTDHQIQSTMHVGTHMDAPLHMISGGKTVDNIALEHFFGKGILVDARGKEKIDMDVVQGIDIAPGSIVLIYTGFGEKYRAKEYFEHIPYVTPAFADVMVKKSVKIVGMDILGPDTDPSWPAHKILLGNDILIIENLTNLDALVGIKNFDIIALPVKYQSNAAPVRVIAKVI